MKAEEKKDSVTTVCQNCQTSNTPLWRRDESGQVLCNACGLFLKLHKRRRPISLKTDVIKSRNRSRSSYTSQLRGGKRAQPMPPHVPMHYPPPPHPMMMHHAHPPPPPPPHFYHPPPPPPPQYDEPPAVHYQPSTPSTVFSYPNSPTLAPYSRNGPTPPYAINSTPASVVNSPRLQPYGQQPHSVQQPLPPPPPPPHHVQQPQQVVLPPPRQIQSSSNSPHLQPSSALPPLVNSNPQQPHQPHQPQQQEKGISMLTPQSRPHSPTSQLKIGSRGEAMSEQLRPRSPGSLDRIPSLKGKEEKTRVGELELVNDLLKSRITQLEASEAAAKRELEQANVKIAQLEQGIKKRSADTNPDQIKRIKVSELI